MKAKRLMILAVIGASLALYYYFRLAPRTSSGEIFIQLHNGRVIYAAGAEVTAFSANSERGKGWFSYLYLDEKRSKRREATYNAKDSTDARALKQMLFYSSDLVALSGILTMPATKGGEAINTVCGAKGQFQLRLRPGSYWIVATGRTGNINGIWSREVDVPGESKVEFSEKDATLDSLLDE